MNLENLEKAIAHIETIPSEKINMASYRKKRGDVEIECNSVGCIIGHCVILAPKLVTYHPWGELLFGEWSYNFFDISHYQKRTWDYLFSAEWKKVEDAKEQALIRMNKVLNGYNPEKDWNCEYEIQTLD